MNHRTTKILIVPIGELPEGLIEGLMPRLEVAIGIPMEKGNAIEPPASAFDQQRGQYLSEEVLKALERVRGPNTRRIVGLIDADCYAPGLNFIFGLAGVNRREALVALPRLRPAVDGSPEAEELFQKRVVKEIIHELGHTWGLAHCRNPRCVMHFSNSLGDTDFKGMAYCQSCQSQL